MCSSLCCKPKFSYEFVAEQLNQIINSPNCSDVLKKAARTMLIENEAKHRQVRSISENVSSDAMPPSSFFLADTLSCATSNHNVPRDVAHCTTSPLVQLVSAEY